MTIPRGGVDAGGELRVVGAVAAGGALGALARLGVATVTDSLGVRTEWAILGVNIVGCLLMGILVSFVLAHPRRHPLWRPLLGVGFLGGFTTFSAFAVDTVLLARDDSLAIAAAYISASLLGGVLAVALGVRAGRGLLLRRQAT